MRQPTPRLQTFVRTACVASAMLSARAAAAPPERGDARATGASAEPPERYGGAALPIPKDAAEIPHWQPPAAADLPAAGAEFSIDLTQSADGQRLLPRVLNQGRRPSCSAWATTYYARTLMEASSLAWDLDPAELDRRAFSPLVTFFRAKRQPSERSDTAISVQTALQVLKDYGALQVSNVPADAPEAIVVDKVKTDSATASSHKIGDYQQIGNRTEMLAALAAQIPVIIHVRVEPTFQNGRFGDVYTKDAFEDGLEKRAVENKDKTPRRLFHAMTVVGYGPIPKTAPSESASIVSPKRDAEEEYGFKIVNSWGADWASNGFAYISTDLFAGDFTCALDPNQDGCDSKFIWQALVIDPLRPPSSDKTLVSKRLTAGRKAGEWTWHVDLVPRKGDSIRTTSWEVNPDDASLRVSEDTGAIGFMHQDTVLRAKVYYEGKSKPEEVSIALSLPRSKSIHLVVPQMTDRYHGNGEWTVDVTINMPAVKKLGAKSLSISGTNTTCDSEGAKISPEKLPYSFACQVSGKSRAELEFTVDYGKRKEKLPVPIRLSSPADDDTRIAVEWFALGELAGADWWAWNARLSGPLSTLNNIESVTWILPKDYDVAKTADKESVKSSTDVQTAFALAESGFSTLKLRAQVRCRNSDRVVTTRPLRVRLKGKQGAVSGRSLRGLCRSS